MMLEQLTQLGINVSLVLDGLFIALVVVCVAFLMVVTSLKGLVGPLFRCKYKRHTMAIIDVGSIESQIMTYPPGSSNLNFKIKTSMGDDEYSWPIPPEEERLLPNGMRYILGSTVFGSLFRISKRAEDLEATKAFFGPKAQARIIEDRAKKLTDKLTKDINKPVIWAVAGLIVIFGLVFAYLIIIKAAEYNLATTMLQSVKEIAPVTTTLPPLPPI
jgi:hypothetical protein